MSFFNDFANALDSYPVDSVDLSIVDVSGPGTSLNVNEVWAFQVRVTNNGHLNMTGVSLLIEGLNGAQVSTSSAGPWLPSLVSASLTVNGGGSQDTVNLYFKAPNVSKPPFTTLVNARLNGWDANLNHLLITNHTNYAPIPIGHHMSQVFPA